MVCRLRHLSKVVLALTIFVSMILFSPTLPRLHSSVENNFVSDENPPASLDSKPYIPWNEPSSSSTDNLWEKCSPRLKDWAMGREEADAFRIIDGRVAVSIVVRHDLDGAFSEDELKIIHSIPFGPGFICYGSIAHQKALLALLTNPNVITVTGDELIPLEEPGTGQAPIPIPGFSHTTPLEITGVQRIWTDFPDINGSGVNVGVVDTGVDFGCTDLVDALAVDSLGRPLSFDPGGSGIAITTYALPSVGGYLLTEGLEFRMFRNDGTLWWSNSTYGIYAENMYIGGRNGIESQSGFYRVGMSVQTAKWLPEERAFFIYLLTDQVTQFVYDTVYIDFETSWAITAEYNDLLASTNEEWDFTNNDPHQFDNNPVLAEDLDGDGYNDYSMGSLSHTFDLTRQISRDIVSGIDPQGRGFAFMFDNHGQGTSVAYGIASRGTEPRNVYHNGSLFTCPGVAPGSKIMALKTFTLADRLQTWYWGCGYRPTAGYDWFNNWTYSGTDVCDILANAWKFHYWSENTRYDMVWSYDLYSMCIDYLSITNTTLFVNSETHMGPGYGTFGAPYATNALMVGRCNPQYSVPSSTGTILYGTEGISQSSNGPTPMGNIGPDIVAPPPLCIDSPLHQFDNAFTSFSVASVTGIAAGICALIKQANANLRNDALKTVIMNGADDLGYEIYRQGAGRINAYRSLHLAFGNATDGTIPILHLSTSTTWDNLYEQDRQNPWRGWYMNMYYSGGYFGYYFDYISLYGNEVKDIIDGKAFPHPVYRGESVSFNLTANTGSLTATGVESLSAYTYQRSAQASITFTTTIPFTTVNLTARFGPSFMTQFLAADNVLIHCSYPFVDYKSLFEATDEGNAIYLFDWQDLNGNNRIDPDNPLEGSCVLADTTQSNCHQLYLGFPAQHFNETPALYYHDRGAVTHLGHPLTVNITITLYERIPWTWVSLHQYTSLESPLYPLLWNVSITTPIDVTPGMYEGYIEAINGTGITHLPLSIRVDLYLSAPGVYHSWGGKQGTPYDNGATFGGINHPNLPLTGDWRFWFVDAYPYPSATPPSYLFVNVTWMDPDTYIDVMLYYSAYGYTLYETDQGLLTTRASVSPRSQVLLFDVSRPGVSSWNYTWCNRGLIAIAVRINQFGGSIGGAEDLLITCAYGVENHPDGFGGFTWGTPSVCINGTDSTHTMAPLLDDSTWIGPHVNFYCNWSDLVIPEFPTITIQQARVALLWTVHHHFFGTINYPVRGGWNPDYNPREAYAFLDLIAGQSVGLSLEYGTWIAGEDSQLWHGFNDDLDYFVWSPGVEHTYANSLTGAGHYGNPSWASFKAPVNGTYTIGIDYYSGVVPMGWTLDAYLYQSKGKSVEGQTCTLDTSLTDENRVYDVQISFATGTNLDHDIPFTSVFVSNVSVQNFIPPTITSLSPNGGELFGPQPFLINWTVTDPNVDYGDEVLRFSVELSNDSGVFWKVIAENLTETSITYDWLESWPEIAFCDMCLVRVNATDGRYNVSRNSMTVFAITPGPGGPPPFPFELYIILAGLATIGILVVILILMIRIRRKSQSWKKIV